MNNERNLPEDTAQELTSVQSQPPSQTQANLTPQGNTNLQPPTVNNNYGNGPQIGTVGGDVVLQINCTPELLQMLPSLFHGSVPNIITANTATPVPAPAATSTEQSPTEPSQATNIPHSAPTTRQPAPAPICTHAIAWNSLSNERFNLFVLENEEYSNGVFCIAKAKAIQNYTNEKDIEQFRFLDADAIAELKKMPCIFAKRNAFYNHTNNNHPAVIGRITEVINQGETI